MAEPDINSSLTPEKRLLELIEEPDAHKREPTVTTKKKDLRELLSPAAFRAKFAGLKDKSDAFLRKHQKSFGIKELNNVLKAVVGLMAFVFIVGFLIDLAGLRQDFAESVRVPEGRMFETEPTREGASSEATVEQWDLGKMFMPYGKRQEEAEKVQKEQSARLAEMIKKLKLTGISYNPADLKSAFCMIEDVEKSITTFLREGDPIGALKVQKIYEDRVVLEQGNETIEIR